MSVWIHFITKTSQSCCGTFAVSATCICCSLDPSLPCGTSPTISKLDIPVSLYNQVGGGLINLVVLLVFPFYMGNQSSEDWVASHHSVHQIVGNISSVPAIYSTEFTEAEYVTKTSPLHLTGDNLVPLVSWHIVHSFFSYFRPYSMLSNSII